MTDKKFTITKEERMRMEGELLVLLPNSNAWSTFDDHSLKVFYDSCFKRRTSIKPLKSTTKIGGVTRINPKKNGNTIS